MAVWLDRNVYTQNLRNKTNSPNGSGGDATDQPGLKEMTLKAIDILNERHNKEGWFLMSEAASIDKQMHTLDYDRALGDLLELDDTVKATFAKLDQLNRTKETLVLVTADHGHGFDVAGSVDTKYLNAQGTDRKKRNAIGTYKESGLSQYVIAGNKSDTSTLQYSEGAAFPANWDPRYFISSPTHYMLQNLLVTLSDIPCSPPSAPIQITAKTTKYTSPAPAYQLSIPP